MRLTGLWQYAQIWAIDVEMIEMGSAFEDEVILAFVRAEVDASRFSRAYPPEVQRDGELRERLIDSPDLTNELENSIRRRLLAYRGYPDQRLFLGFPRDVRWRKAMLQPEDFPRLKVGEWPNWKALSDGSYRVVDCARNLDSSDDAKLVDRIRAVAERAKSGDRFPELILVESGADDLVVFEGTTRATAFAVIDTSDWLRVFVGTSDNIQQWHHLPPI